MIELHQISKIYQPPHKKIYALKNVNLRIQRQDFVVVMGESGSGKSTLLQIIGCLQKADEGEYRWKNQNVMQLSNRELAKIRNQHIGFVFQQFYLIPYLDVYENVRLPMVYAKVDESKQQQQVTQLLRLFHLWERRHHLPNQLSGGQQQRVAIARALINRPEVILCDEPTAGLDPLHANQMVQLLKLMNRYGSTIIMVTHDMKYQKIGNRLFYVKHGEVMECKR